VGVRSGFALEGNEAGELQLLLHILANKCDREALTELAANAGQLAPQDVRSGIAIGNENLEQRVNGDGGNGTSIGIADSCLDTQGEVLV